MSWGWLTLQPSQSRLCDMQSMKHRMWLICQPQLVRKLWTFEKAFEKSLWSHQLHAALKGLLLECPWYERLTWRCPWECIFHTVHEKRANFVHTNTCHCGNVQWGSLQIRAGSIWSVLWWGAWFRVECKCCGRQSLPCYGASELGQVRWVILTGQVSYTRAVL